MTQKEFAFYFDHTILKAVTTREQLGEVCRQAARYGFHSVAVNSGMVADCAGFLSGSGVLVDAAVGFPLGITSVATKVAEARDAISSGAGEVDYVINIGRLKEHDREYLTREMSAMVSVCREAGVLCKVIFENCYLTDDEKLLACEIAGKVRPDFIKTSTGFGPSSATVEDVRLMKNAVGDGVAVKAAGGIKTLGTALALIEAGASRLGCSASVGIVEEYTLKYIK